MRKSRKTLYLNKTILLIVMLGYSAFLVSMLFMDWYLIREYQNRNMKAERNVLNDYVGKIEDSMERIDRLLYNIYANDENFQALRKKEKPVQEYGHAYELKELLSMRMYLEENMSGFFIFYDNMQKVWYNVDTAQIKPEQTEEIKERLKIRLETAGKTRSWTTVTVDGDTNLAILYKKENVAVYGILSLRSAEEELRERLGRIVEAVLEEDEIALKNQELAEQLGLNELTEQYSDSLSERKGKYQIYGSRIPNTNLWLYAVYKINLWNFMNIQQLLLLALTVLSVCAVIVLYIFMRKQIASPIRQLTETMNRIRSGETKVVPEISSRFHEIQEVNETLDKMVRELEKQKLLVYEEIIEKQKAQMQYLQLQLKPHFYLNSLKTLNALAMENQTDKMQDLIMNLSSHLRYLLQTDREIVPLSMEMEFVENYVNMQKHLTGRPVICEIEIDEHVKNWLIPVLAVHTFVENSVKYARLGDSRIPLEIQVTADYLATEDGGYLNIIVRDNGQGYPEKIIEEINREASPGKRNVGINNLKRRCRLLYGEKAEYNFDNCDGALSELILPEMEEER